MGCVGVVDTVACGAGGSIIWDIAPRHHSVQDMTRPSEFPGETGVPNTSRVGSTSHMDPEQITHIAFHRHSRGVDHAWPPQWNTVNVSAEAGAGSIACIHRLLRR